MNSQGMFGTQQGSSGASQGYQGAQEGLSNGASTGMQRAASGGMTPSAPGTTSQARKPMGLFSFLAPIASAIPGVGPLVGAGLSAIGSMQDQNAAKAAAAAAQGAQGNALAGASGLVDQLTGQPDYSDIIKAETSGINTLKRNLGGIANPGAVLQDMQGKNILNAIEGAQADQNANLRAGAGLLQGNAYQYGGIGERAGAAAAGMPNPFSLFSNALTGAQSPNWNSLFGGVFGANPSPTQPINTNPESGGIDLSAGIKPTPTTPLNPNSIAPPPNIGRGWGSMQ